MDKNTDKYIEYQKIIGKKQCPLCKRFFKNLGFGNHYRICKLKGGDWSKPSKPKIRHFCKFCGKEWPSRDARNGHQNKCHSNPKREECIQKISKSKTGYVMPQEIKNKIRNSMKVFHFECKRRGEHVIGKETIVNKTEDGEENPLNLFFKNEL